MKRFSFLSLLLFFALLSTNLLARPGDLDRTFGTGGRVYGTPANFTPAQDVALHSDGKIVIVGFTVGPDLSQDFGVVRLNSDGTPDAEFGSNGLLSIAFDNSALEHALNVAIQADGKILVAGEVRSDATSRTIGVVRLNYDGSIDTSFSGGRVKTNIGQNDFPGGMLLQPDGKIVIAFSTLRSGSSDAAVVRLTSEGALDPSFNGTGSVFVAVGNGNDDSALAVTLQPDGKLVVAGSTRVAIRTYFLLFRIDSSGVLDTSFGDLGIVQTAIGSTDDYAHAVALQTDGKVVAAGRSHGGSSDRAAFARYKSDGTLDPTFDGDGKLRLNIRPDHSSALTSVFVYPNGAIIGVGSGGAQYALARLNPDGSPDSSFGTSGIVLENIASEYSVAYRATVQPDGKVVVVGEGSEGSIFGYTAARFLTYDPPAPFDFDGDGRADVGIFRPSVAEWWIYRSGSGSVFAAQFGATTDKIVPGDYTGDGRTDVAFWRPATGEWSVIRSEDNTYYSGPFGTAGDIPTPADYDADGKADVAVFRPSSGSWFIQRSSDGSVTSAQFGGGGDVPVVGDYDGDGRADISIYHVAAGEWWLNRTTAGLIVYQFGNSTDKQVPGDYTGDGKTDVAFWRPASGEWFVIRSEDTSYFSAPFGADGDIPAPGDYDGDGKSDVTVFRPSSGNWFVNRSSGGTTAQQFGQNGDRPLPNAFVP
jgi:uncharacterized delta-60 repeat protein